MTEIFAMNDPTVESATTGKSFDELYDLGHELGTGVFSVVCAGEHKTTKEQYAIKIIQKPDMEEFDKRCLQQEIAALSELRHPHIIRLYDVFDSGTDQIQLVLEMVPGGELLDRLISKTTYTEREARDVCQVVANAINYCHSKKIAHRDLKPENLLLSSNESDTAIKIADFGFAKKCPDDTSLKTQCGSAQHVAPEILKNLAYGTKVDMWALGVIQYTLIGGIPPFYAASNQETFQKILKAKIEFPDELWGHVSQDCKDMIQGLLTLDPNERWSPPQILDCQWMLDDASDLDKTSLHINQEKLRAFNAQQKLKAAVYALIGLNRMQYNGEEIPALQELREEEDGEFAITSSEKAEPSQESTQDVLHDQPDYAVVPNSEKTVEEQESEVHPPPMKEQVLEQAEPVPEPQQLAAPTNTPVVPTPTATSRTIVTRDVYAAFQVAECHAEPPSKDYFALANASRAFFTSALENLYGKDAVESVQVSMRKSLFNAAKPSEEYNIYVEFDITANFSATDMMDVTPPTRRDLCTSLIQSDLAQYLLDYVRPMEDTQFVTVTNCFFGHFAF